jgi:hypothetical protein
MSLRIRWDSAPMASYSSRTVSMLSASCVLGFDSTACAQGVDRARKHGPTPSSLSHPPKAHAAAINFTQRFGSSLAINIHFHALVLDGVYTTDGPDAIPTFHPAPSLTQDEVHRVRRDIYRRIDRVLNAHGLVPSPSPLPGPRSKPPLWKSYPPSPCRQ